MITLDQPTDYLNPDFGGVIGLGYSQNEDNQATLLHILPENQRIFAVLINASVYDVTYGAYNQNFIAPGEKSEGYGIHWFNLHYTKDSWSIPL